MIHACGNNLCKMPTSPKLLSSHKCLVSMIPYRWKFSLPHLQMSTLETLLPGAARYSTALLDTLGSEAADSSQEPLNTQQSMAKESVAADGVEEATTLAKACSLQEQPCLVSLSIRLGTEACDVQLLTSCIYGHAHCSTRPNFWTCTLKELTIFL